MLSNAMKSVFKSTQGGGFWLVDKSSIHQGDQGLFSFVVFS